LDFLDGDEDVAELHALTGRRGRLGCLSYATDQDEDTEGKQKQPKPGGRHNV